MLAQQLALEQKQFERLKHDFKYKCVGRIGSLAPCDIALPVPFSSSLLPAQ